MKKHKKVIIDLRNLYNLTQSQIAKVMKISRETVAQIESGKRNLTLDDICLLSDYFNLTVEELLSRKGYQTRIKAGTGKKKKQKEIIRISVPQKNIKKLKEVFLYLINKIGAKPNIGETVLYKLLYFIDFNYYEKYEEQLIGATYIKNKFGPTPVEFKKIIDILLKNKEVIKVDNKHFGYMQRKYLPLREPDLTVLSAAELQEINNTIDKLSGMSAKEISEYSHKDIPFATSESGQVIEYESVFYRTPEYSARTYT